MAHNPHAIIDYIMTESTVIHNLNETEREQVRKALTLDLNQYVMNVLLTIMESDDLDAIENLIDNNDEAGMIDLVNTVSEKPNIAHALEEKLNDYLDVTIHDFKKIKKLLQAQKSKENRKSSES